jgi:demethylmenaquinone methyltransferase/2-methoxy-6-polyprenyl-1,4-benzoquinol methylase
VILDIGGGTGHIATYLSRQCKKVYVLDESEKMLSKVQATDKVIPVVGDAFKIEIDEKIDVVLLTDVLHHIKEQEKLIDAIYGQLPTTLKGSGL